MPCAAPGCHPGPAPPVFPGCSIGPVVIAPDAEDPDKKILYWYPALSNEHRIEIWVLLTPRARKWISSRLKAEYDLFCTEDAETSLRVRHYLERFHDRRLHHRFFGCLTIV